jgi:hypothetical protein
MMNGRLPGIELALVFVLAACASGDDGDDGDDDGASDGGETPAIDAAVGSVDAAADLPDADEGGSTFTCSSMACRTGQEYCLIFLVDEVESSVMCADLPDACLDCDCAGEDALGRYPAAADCTECAISMVGGAPSSTEISIWCR